MLLVKHQKMYTIEHLSWEQCVYTETADFTHKAHYTLGRDERKKQASNHR